MSELVKTTVRIPRSQLELLKRRAAKSGVSQSQYICNLLKKKTLAAEPPPELWETMDMLYNIHDMLLRIHKPEFDEAARRLERCVVELQGVFTEPEKAVS